MLTTKELDQLTPEERGAYNQLSLIDQMGFTNDWRRSKSVEAYQKGPKPPTSLMRTAGMAGTVGFLLLTVFSMIAVMGSSYDEPGDPLWPILFASLFGLSVFMWMLGAIEHRLILINETLKRQG